MEVRCKKKAAKSEKVGLMILNVSHNYQSVLCIYALPVKKRGIYNFCKKNKLQRTKSFLHVSRYIHCSNSQHYR